jgi:hypothetical protein
MGAGASTNAGLIEHWTPEQVCAWLKQVHEQVEERFRACAIDGQQLKTMTDSGAVAKLLDMHSVHAASIAEHIKPLVSTVHFSSELRAQVHALMAAKQLTPDDMFRRIDTDDNGVIDQAEFLAALQDLGIPITPARMAVIWPTFVREAEQHQIALPQWRAFLGLATDGAACAEGAGAGGQNVLGEGYQPDVDDFVVESRLGKGAFGDVWRTVHRRTGATYALKVGHSLALSTAPHPCNTLTKHCGHLFFGDEDDRQGARHRDRLLGVRRAGEGAAGAAARTRGLPLHRAGESAVCGPVNVHRVRPVHRVATRSRAPASSRQSAHWPVRRAGTHLRTRALAHSTLRLPDRPHSNTHHTPQQLADSAG